MRVTEDFLMPYWQNFLGGSGNQTILLKMKNKQKITLTILGVLIGLVIGIFFVKSDRKKHLDEFEKEKASIVQEVKKRESALQYTIDSLKSEIVYINASHALDTAKTLSDLGSITNLLLNDRVDYEDGTAKCEAWSIIEQLRPDDIRGRLYTLGQLFFNSEARSINSAEDLKNFQRDLRSAGRIVPVYQLNDHTDIQTYWDKISRFGKH